MDYWTIHYAVELIGAMTMCVFIGAEHIKSRLRMHEAQERLKQSNIWPTINGVKL